MEGDQEKATTSLVESKDISVDRHSRKRASISRSPSPYRSPGRPRSRSGSRSPYRESRGSKRPAEDDHYDRKGNDPRRFKVRYEDLSVGGRVMQNTFQNDRHRRRNGIDQRQTYNDQGTNRRPRDDYHKRSRSPPAHYRGHQGQHGKISRHECVNSQSWQKPNGVRYGEGRSKFPGQQSVSDRIQISIAATRSKPDNEMRNNQRQQNDHGVNADSQDLAKYVLDPSQRPRIDHCSNSTERGSLGTTAGITEAANDVPADEATLIEERRKRREAIKAKHKGQATPHLVHALAIDTSAPSTPRASASANPTPASGEDQCQDYKGGADRESAASPRASPAATPEDTLDQDVSAEFSVAKDSDLANSSVVVDDTARADEPSAADYDPTMDMQEDKIRQHQQQQHLAEMSASTYDENVNAHQDVLLPNSQAPPSPTPKARDELDMFGDDDELDMFAEVPMAVPKAKNEVTKAVPIPHGKTVDMSMLDDYDDPDGYYKVILGELLDSRYHVQSNLGKGMFSGVVRATDQKTNKLVAIKLARNNEAMRKTGIKEIGILEKLMASDPEDKKHIIRLERYFEHKGHLCMVFENLSIDLREVLKKFGRDVGINLKAVREYARQMFLGLSLLRKCNVLHADLKPDNVLVNEARSTLKICDLGSASDASENEITQYLVSRFYRAPEIILGLPYDFAIDMWSVGCTLFELYTGKILFTGRSNNQMLRSIMECRGKFSHKLLRRGEFAEEAEVKELNLFVDLLDRCLNLNPEKRCTPNEALKHPFIMRTKEI